MARMIGKQWDVHVCHPQCAGADMGKSPNRKAKTLYKRHLKQQEKQRLKREIKEEREK